MLEAREKIELDLSELEAHTTYGLDVVGALWIRFYLLSDTLNVYVRCAGFAVELSVPKMLHDLPPAVDPSRRGRKESKDLKFRGSQIDAAFLSRDLPAQKIDYKARKY